MTLISHGDAFEIYYALGATRTLPKLLDAVHEQSTHDTPAPDTLKKWSARYKWKNKVVIRDNEASAGVAEKMTAAQVDVKMKELEHLDRAMGEIDMVMPMIFDALQSCTITDPETGKKHVKIIPENTQDMVALYNAQSRFVGAKIKLVETVRKIMGESDNVNVTATFKQAVTADPDVMRVANELAMKLSQHK